MLLIPNHWGQKEEQKGEQKNVEAGPPEFAPEFRHDAQQEQNRKKLKRVFVFAKKAQPDQDAGARPKDGEPWAALNREPKEIKGRRPEENR